jgi:cytochrome c oxidase subunit 3
MATHAGTADTPVPSAPGQPRISAGMLAMLLFIGSEVMLFASLFTAYFFVRFNVAENVWPPVNPITGEQYELPKVITGVNTCFLVSSSFTVWWAEHRLKHNDYKGLYRGLLVTIFLGATFLIILINEYAHLDFTPQDQAFGSSFYVLTGAHGLHVAAGLSLLTVAYIRAKRGDFTPQWATPLNAASAYWHFVDVVWVLLYCLVYLLPGS